VVADVIHAARIVTGLSPIARFLLAPHAARIVTGLSLIPWMGDFEPVVGGLMRRGRTWTGLVRA
jgi:hypothetical protein